ncbi:gluconokinase [Cryptococcus wingfieldii CBS 7118]|uniref:gluconokinase n=1 Tax=Cryptococcus wingfieldii CBS 7118 TaxID=1295528 RepID=A0A1E3K3L0_9TREE|nr:gluconokinase [Cryptococcus wingfieldii CBS 7118]ODO07629.1 gluconokinase [Cryptococcus wingfieldii CBS 7118]
MSPKPEHELTVPAHLPAPVLIIAMGPASCGKSTIGTDLASSLHIPFIDGDSLHPKSNVEKMSRGEALSDEDRLPWLALIRSTAERVCKEESEKGEGGEDGAGAGGIGRPGVVVACSALKGWYRDILRGVVEADPPPKDDLVEDHPAPNAHHRATSNLKTYFVYCCGTPELLQERIAARKGHFFGAQMLEGQLAILEDPRGEEDVVAVDIDGTREVVGQRAVEGVRGLLE